MKKINFKSLAFFTLVPLMLSFVISMLIPDYKEFYNNLEKPLDVPMIVFPIVWSILYILLGIAGYIVDSKGGSLKLYTLLIIMILAWPVVFFYFHLNGISAILTGLTLILGILVAINFYKVSQASGLLIIPFILWVAFATYLSSGIYFMNM